MQLSDVVSIAKLEARRQEIPFPPSTFILNLVSFVVFFSICLKSDYLLVGSDGQFMREIAREQFARLPHQLGFSNNFLQGLGNIWFPLNTRIVPGYVTFDYFSNQIAAVTAAYVVFSLELFLATTLAGRICRLPWSTCLAAAWILPLIAMPVFGFPSLYVIMVLAPTVATLIVVNTLAIASFRVSGTNHAIHTVFAGALLLICLLYILLFNPPAVVLAAPILAIFCLAFLLCATRSEVFSKLIVLVGVAAVMLLGPAEYIVGLLTYTAVNFFPDDFFNDRKSPIYISIALHGGIGTVLAILALAGASVLIFLREGRNRASIAAILVTSGLILLAGAVSMYSDAWRGPSPLYTEFLLWPFWVVLAIEAIRLLGIVVLKSVPSASQRGSSSFVARYGTALVAIAPWLLAPYILQVKPDTDAMRVHNVQTSPSPIVNILRREISFESSTEFRGRVATFLGMTELNRSLSWFDLHGIDYKLLNEIGNDHHMVGLWHYKIPTLMEYSPLISPAFHATAVRLLGHLKDVQVRNTLTLRNPRQKYLAAIGVRYVISDAPIEDLPLRKAVTVPNFGILYLYEVNSANVGTYTPIVSRVASSLENALDVLSSPDFDFERQVVLNAPVVENIALVKATAARLSVEGDALQVRATSSGWSLLLLPVEFSHCLTLESPSRAKLMRANVLQTAILFERRLDATLRFFLGPFRNAGCKLKDAEEFRRITAGMT